MRQKLIFWTRQLGCEIIGSILIAVGIYNFAVNAEFPMTGFSGISILLYQIFDVPIGLSTILLNIPVAILCYHLLGKTFFVNSVRSIIISSLFIDYIAPLFPAYTGSPLLAALCTGVLAGLGYALIYMVNSSTGGADFIILATKAVHPHLSIGKISFFFDASIVLLGTLYFRNVDGIIYGFIVSYLLSTVMDKMMYGVNSGKLALIVTNNGKQISDVIDQCCQRGSTIFSARGGYQEDNRDVVMCACSSKEMYLVQQAVKAVEPNAFIIIVDSNEVHGEGFHPIVVGERQDR
ncbi:MAG: YitT family protein [Lachnospiraceae bacterium]